MDHERSNLRQQHSGKVDVIDVLAARQTACRVPVIQANVLPAAMD